MGAATGLRLRNFAPYALTGVLLLLASYVAPSAAQSRLQTELRGRAAIRFEGTSTLHGFSGSGEAAEFAIKPNDKQHWDAEAEVPVASLDTGNSWRDDDMRTMFGAEEFPVIRARFADIDPAAVQAAGTISFALTIRKVTRPIAARVTEWKQDADSARFAAEFDVSLAAFGLEAPATLFLKVGDTVHVTVQATVKRA